MATNFNIEYLLKTNKTVFIDNILRIIACIQINNWHQCHLLIYFKTFFICNQDYQLHVKWYFRHIHGNEIPNTFITKQIWKIWTIMSNTFMYVWHFLPPTPSMNRFWKMKLFDSVIINEIALMNKSFFGRMGTM